MSSFPYDPYKSTAPSSPTGQTGQIDTWTAAIDHSHSLDLSDDSDHLEDLEDIRTLAEREDPSVQGVVKTEAHHPVSTRPKRHIDQRDSSISTRPARRHPLLSLSPNQPIHYRSSKKKAKSKGRLKSKARTNVDPEGSPKPYVAASYRATNASTYSSAIYLPVEDGSQIPLKNHRGQLLEVPDGSQLEVNDLLILHPPTLNADGSEIVRAQDSNDSGGDHGPALEVALGNASGPINQYSPFPAPENYKSTYEMYTCRLCAKTYDGKNARSVARRHLQDKHGVPLAVQKRRSRWDYEVDRPKNLSDARERSLKAKRDWAVKNRQQIRLEKRFAEFLEPYGPDGIITPCGLRLICPDFRGISAHVQADESYLEGSLSWEELPDELVAGITALRELEKKISEGRMSGDVSFDESSARGVKATLGPHDGEDSLEVDTSLEYDRQNGEEEEIRMHQELGIRQGKYGRPHRARRHKPISTSTSSGISPPRMTKYSYLLTQQRTPVSETRSTRVKARSDDGPSSEDAVNFGSGTQVDVDERSLHMAWAQHYGSAIPHYGVIRSVEGANDGQEASGRVATDHPPPSRDDAVKTLQVNHATSNHIQITQHMIANQVVWYAHPDHGLIPAFAVDQSSLDQVQLGLSSDAPQHTQQPQQHVILPHQDVQALGNEAFDEDETLYEIGEILRAQDRSVIEAIEAHVESVAAESLLNLHSTPARPDDDDTNSARARGESDGDEETTRDQRYLEAPIELRKFTTETDRTQSALAPLDQVILRLLDPPEITPRPKISRAQSFIEPSAAFAKARPDAPSRSLSFAHPTMLDDPFALSPGWLPSSGTETSEGVSQSGGSGNMLSVPKKRRSTVGSPSPLLKRKKDGNKRSSNSIHSLSLVSESPHEKRAVPPQVVNKSLPSITEQPSSPPPRQPLQPLRSNRPGLFSTPPRGTNRRTTISSPKALVKTPGANVPSSLSKVAWVFSSPGGDTAATLGLVPSWSGNTMGNTPGLSGIVGAETPFGTRESL